MNYDFDYEELLQYIDPAQLDYQSWVNVGMALKAEGCPVSLWDSWSMRDYRRYHDGECQKKWNSFLGSETPVTGATIVQMAKENGWGYSSEEGYSLDWDSEISREAGVVIDKHYLEGKELSAPADFDPVKEITTYLETLFAPDETIGYVMESYEKDGKFIPANKGSYRHTAGELIEKLSKCGGDTGAVLGDYNEQGGAWIRFNPLDGNGVKNENVTEYRYALVESDSEEIEKQNAIIRELELPVACLVYSGGKSLHAIVRIEAADYNEYRKRVDYLYEICRKNGLEIDRQNRNPSRLSRLPGVRRGSQLQYIVDTNIGKASFSEWKDFVESVNDDLPDPESMASVWDDLPELSPPLIDGVLRQGHKMLIAGPSKAGKSYALIELCCSIAEGKPWFGFECARGKVMYVNLELDRASCLHRFKDVYTALNWEPDNLQNIDIWNLRGHSVPMDKLAPKLIRRALKKNYIAIIIDPIYKVITGDENSADQMAHFCNQFDKVCTELGCAVIYCHHHSKGAQGGKRSMDRASGSGVFARDPDALLDLIELNLTDDITKQEKNKAVCAAVQDYLHKKGFGDAAGQDDLCSSSQMLKIAREKLSDSSLDELATVTDNAEKQAESLSAWRIEGTLREFPKFAPLNLWFDYPIHRADDTGTLTDISTEAGYNSKGSPYKNNFKKKKTPEERKKERKESLDTAFDMCITEEQSIVKVSELATYLGVTEKTVKKRIKESDLYWEQYGVVGRKSR